LPPATAAAEQQHHEQHVCTAGKSILGDDVSRQSSVHHRTVQLSAISQTTEAHLTYFEML